MLKNNIENAFSNNEAPWISHPKNNGVSLKHLVVGKSTNNRLSCHLVRIEPNCKIDNHFHDGQLEIHEIIAGDGLCKYTDHNISYSVGNINVLPDNVEHEITAGPQGLYILAKFSPALL